MITVFYDGICGLCRREIAHYQRITPQGIFTWVDITADPSVTQHIGISYADGLRALHATDATGKLHVGVDAFLLIWRQMPRWRVLAAMVALPVIRPLASLAYRAFAAWRFRRLTHCQIARSAEDAPQE